MYTSAGLAEVVIPGAAAGFWILDRSRSVSISFASSDMGSCVSDAKLRVSRGARHCFNKVRGAIRSLME